MLEVRLIVEDNITYISISWCVHRFKLTMLFCEINFKTYRIGFKQRIQTIQTDLRTSRVMSLHAKFINFGLS